MTGRIIKASFAVNTALARMSPLELTAEMYVEEVSELKRKGTTIFIPP